MLIKKGKKLYSFLFFCLLFFMPIPLIMAGESDDRQTDKTGQETKSKMEPQLLVHYSLCGIVCDISKPENSDTFIIKALFPYEISPDYLIAEFETRENTLVFVNNEKQISGITANDFSVPVIYRLKHNNGIIQEYRVRIIVKPEFRMDIGGNFHPSYDATYGMVHIGYDGDFFIGGKFNNFLIGLEITDSYFVFNGQSKGENVSGYWNILRGAFVHQISLSKTWGLKWGLGGSWMNSEFEYKDITRYTRNNPGLFLQFALNLSLAKYVRIDFLNQFDLFMDTEDGNPFTTIENFYPYYKGGLHISFHNFIKWLRIHFGISGLYSYYMKDDINTTMKMIVVDAGLHFKLQFPSIGKPSLIGNQKFDSIKSAGSGIESLKTAKQNDIIEFPGISFKKDSNELTDESLEILATIAEILIEKENMEILVKIFIKHIDDPVSLIPMATKKLGVIKQSLVERGIQEDRIHIPVEVSMLGDTYSDTSMLIKIVVNKPEGD